MSPSIGISIYTGSDLSTSVLNSNITMLRRDSSASESGSRQAYPIPEASKSVTRWIKPFLNASPDNSPVFDLQMWGPGTTDTSTCLYCGTTSSASPPSFNASGSAVTNFTDYCASAKWSFDSGSYSASGPTDRYIIFQLATASPLTAGSRTQEVVNYQWAQTFYGESEDGYIYGANSTYATARSTATAAITTGSIAIGQRLISTLHVIYRGYLSFDTSEIPVGASIVAASLFVAASQDASTCDLNVQCYRFNWNESLGGSDMETNYDGAYGATASLEGTFRDTADGWVSGTYYSMPITASGINSGCDTKLTLVSSCDIANTEASTSEYVVIYDSDAAASLIPYLLVQTACSFTIDCILSKRRRRWF